MLYKVAEDEKARLEIHTDEDSESPREWSNVGHMICWHSRYVLGDDHDFSRPLSFMDDLFTQQTGIYDDDDKFDDAENREAAFHKAVYEWFEKNVICLQLYLYEHSGISMSCSSFIGRAQHADWDSGPVGYIYCTMDEARKEWKGTDEEIREQAKKCLECEVDVYDQYLRGDVCGFKLFTKKRCDSCGHTELEETDDSCWGFFGEESLKGEIPEKYSHLLDKLEYAD